MRVRIACITCFWLLLGATASAAAAESLKECVTKAREKSPELGLAITQLLALRECGQPAITDLSEAVAREASAFQALPAPLATLVRSAPGQDDLKAITERADRHAKQAQDALTEARNAAEGKGPGVGDGAVPPEPKFAQPPLEQLVAASLVAEQNVLKAQGYANARRDTLRNVNAICEFVDGAVRSAHPGCQRAELSSLGPTPAERWNYAFEGYEDKLLVDAQTYLNTALDELVKCDGARDEASPECKPAEVLRKQLGQRNPMFCMFSSDCPLRARLDDDDRELARSVTRFLSGAPGLGRDALLSEIENRANLKCGSLHRRLVGARGSAATACEQDWRTWQTFADFELAGMKEPRVGDMQASVSLAAVTGSVVERPPDWFPTRDELGSEAFHRLARTWRDIASKVWKPERCPEQAIINGSEIAPLKYYLTCVDTGALKAGDRRSIQLWLAFGTAALAGSSPGSSWWYLEQALERMRIHESVAASNDLSVAVRLAAARARLIFGSERRSIALAREAERFASTDALRADTFEVLAVAHEASGEHVAAAAAYRRAAGLTRAASARERSVRFSALAANAHARHLVKSASATGALLAKRELGRALADVRKTFPGVLPEEGRNLLVSLALLAEREGNWHTANELFEQARSDARDATLSWYTAELADHFLRRGQPKQALRVAEAANLKCNQRSTGQEAVARARLTAAALSLERNDAHKLANLLECMRYAISAARSVVELRRLNRSLHELGSVAAAVALTPHVSQEQLVGAFDILVALKDFVSLGLSNANENERLDLFMRQPKAVDLHAIRSELTQDSMRLEFVSYTPAMRRRGEKRESRMLLFRVTPSRVTAHDLGAERALSKLVRKAEARIANRWSNPSVSLRTLHRQLFANLPPIDRRVKELFISPEGVLVGFPFEALSSERGYLTEEYAITYQTAINLQRGGNVASGVLVIGAPTFVGGAHGFLHTLGAVVNREAYWSELPPLAGAAHEVRAVSQAYRTSVVLEGTDATEWRVRDVLGQTQFGVIHLATHGLARSTTPAEVASATPEQSAIALARGPVRSGRGSYDDGWLTELELADLQLSSTDLVVLSACESGLGRKRDGERLMGMRRALLVHAGARSVISSLWKVDDAATHRFMVALHETLRSGGRRSSAMRSAAAVVRRSYPHPYFWAAFQLAGESGPLRAATP